MKRLDCIIGTIVMLMFCISVVNAQPLIKQRHPNVIPGPVTNVVYTQQGYNMKLWMSNSGVLGYYGYETGGINLEYPAGSNIEHLFAGGPRIGALVYDSLNQSYYPNIRVTEMFNGGDARNEARGTDDHFWQTSIDTPNGHNRRHYDDDGDGKIDEDELDGLDNDGDWNPLRDDVGMDGFADRFEMSCDGIPYDSLTNPDPAQDNYDPLQKSKCPVNYTGTLPYKNDINVYTENNNKPDHGEPNVDEDYGAISENDLSCAYADTFSRPQIGGHVGMGIKVWQKSLAWKNRVKEPILPIEYTFVNIGKKIFKDVYLAFFLDPDVGPIDVNEYPNNNYVGYIDSLRTFYCHNPVDRGSTPLGLTLLDASTPLDSLSYCFQWADYSTKCDGSYGDSILYMQMNCSAFLCSSGPFSEPPSYMSDVRMFISIGPFPTMYPGDTVKCAVAFVSGDAIAEVPNSLRDNAAKAISISKHGYENINIPSPPLHVKREGFNIILDWKWKPGDIGNDPLENWDEHNEYLTSLPDTHWRKKNPPDGKTKGGRNLEGFKLWRSESDTFNVESFTMLAQYDADDDLGFGSQTGLRFTFVDSTLKAYNKYWYAVTSYSIPEGMTIPFPDAGGVIHQANLIGPPVESELIENATQTHLLFEPSKKLGEVLVVPNPYRADVPYTDGFGFEGPSYNWTPDKRVIWFIRLPEKATIRIYTIAGEIIQTIHHDDAERRLRGLATGQEEWDLFSESRRPIASGVFVFSVDSDFGQQIGKFVIIK